MVSFILELNFDFVVKNLLNNKLFMKIFVDLLSSKGMLDFCA